MPNYTPQKYNTLMEMLGASMRQGMHSGSTGAEQAMRGEQAQALHQQESESALKNLLAGKQADLSNKQSEQANSMQNMAKTLGIDTSQPGWEAQVGEAARNSGAGYGVKDGAFDITRIPTPPKDPGPQQGKDFRKVAESEYKPINDQVDSAKSTLDFLNQKNAASDKLALISEAKFAAGTGGSRAIKSIMDSLTGGKTAGMDYQTALNYFNNTPNVPTMQDPQRDAIRESVYGRLPQIGELHNQAAQKLSKIGASAYPSADYQGLIGAYSTPVGQKMGALNKMAGDYQAQRAQMQDAPVGQATTADPNQSMVDKITGGLHSLLGQSPQSGPHGPSVNQGGVTYKWNPTKNTYEE